MDQKEIIITTEKTIHIKLTSSHSTNFGKDNHLFFFRYICQLSFTIELVLIPCVFEAAAFTELFCQLSIWCLLTTFFYFLFVVIDYVFQTKYENALIKLNFTIFSLSFCSLLFFQCYLVGPIIKLWDEIPNHYGIIRWNIIPFVIIFIDTIWNKHVFILKQGWLPLVGGTFYLLLNAIYSLMEKDSMYPIMTWRRWATIWYVIVYFLMIFGGIFFAYYLKICIQKPKNAKSSNQKNNRKSSTKSSLKSALSKSLKIKI